MTTQTDPELLRDYAAKGEESSFAHLVERHIGLVYSAALRIVVDPHLAQDVTQTTFAALAREARHLIDHPALSSWLHRTASNQAAKLVRGEMRRRTREQEVHAMQQPATESEEQWKQIAPLLDGAINQLPERDRMVIILRFFGTKSAREIAAALRVSEEAAQKRVNRAVERLRQVFARRGVTLSAATLAMFFASQASAAVPPGLALTVTSGALAGGTAAAEISLSTLKLILMSKLKTSAICALVVAGAVTTWTLQKQPSAKLVAPPAAVVADIETGPPTNAVTSPEEARARHEAEVAQNLKMLKDVGMQLRRSMRGKQNGNIDADEMFEMVGAGNDGRKKVELLVPSIKDLREIMSQTPQTIVARTTEPIRTPDGKWLRIYAMADGSAQQRTTDDPAEIFEGRWQRSQAK